MIDDLFQEAKMLLNPRDIVIDFLGEPSKISGDNYFWKSPFYDGDNDPSFCVSPEQISDFSSGSDFGNGNDIFNFIVKYNDLTHCITENKMSSIEALKWVNQNYNLGLKLNTVNDTKNTNISKTTKKLIKVKYSLKLKENAKSATTNGIYAYFDEHKFSKKPNGDETGKIKNSIDKDYAGVYYIDEIKKMLIDGQTCIPSAIKSKNDWKDEENYYQIFMLDFDNSIVENKKKTKLMIDDERHITVDKILAYCKSINLIPSFIYYTFSHTEKQHKFRVVYILDKPLNQKKVVEGIYSYFKELFKDFYIDTAACDIARLFYGGKKLAFESNNYFEVVAEEFEEDCENSENSNKTEYSEIEQQINKYLKYTNYDARKGQLGYFTQKGSFTKISNFLPYCTTKINYKNGNDTVTKYEMNCVLIDRPNYHLNPILIDTNSYAKCDFILGSSWDKHCIVAAGNGNVGRLREVMQIISRETMQEKNVYTHTGFRKINDKLCYLYHGGVIGDIENVETDLSSDKLQQYCFTNKTFDLKQSIRRSLSFLDIADYSITMPILATVYLSPLKSLLSRNDILADFILFIQGQSGTRKSSLVATALSHFGKFDRDNFPCSFRDTLNSIEKKSFILKDTINVVDDFNPENVGSKKLDIVEKLFGMYGDRTGRTRMSQDGLTLREPYVARGLCIVTGEMLPEVAQSRIARSLIVNIQPDSLDLSKLSEIQENTSELAYSMMNFIKWCINNENSVIEYAKNMFKNNREYSNNNNDVHGRTREIINILPIGFTLFTLFAKQKGVLSDEDKSKLDTKIIEVLNTLVEEQTQEVKELKPVQMFYSAIEELILAHTIRVTNIKNNIDIGIGKDVGYYDEDKKRLYLYPTVIYNEVTKFYNGKFPIPANTLWKYMAEESLLYQNDKKRYKVARTIFGKQTFVIDIDANLLSIPNCQQRFSNFNNHQKF